MDLALPTLPFLGITHTEVACLPSSIVAAALSGSSLLLCLFSAVPVLPIALVAFLVVSLSLKLAKRCFFFLPFIFISWWIITS